jgi:hypothetical protein
LLKFVRQTRGNFLTLRPEYDAQVGRFYREQEGIQLYRGEWARQEKAIRHALEFFKAAGLDPFELSDKLASMDQEQILTMPDCENRDFVQALNPDEFPFLDDNKVVTRAENVIRQVVEAIEDLEKAEKKPVMPQVSVVAPKLPVPPAPVPSLLLPPTRLPSPVPSAPLPSIPRETPVQSGTCPVTYMDLAVCTYAVFVIRSSTGKINLSSGRGVDLAYDRILVPSGMAFDCGREQFKNGILEGMANGLIRHFQTSGGKDLFQPTAQGFTQAEKLYPLLPADFKQRIRNAYEVLKQTDGGYR